jgi:hypothetical protein
MVALALGRTSPTDRRGILIHPEIRVLLSWWARPSGDVDSS